ncbi:hypothetical protein C8J27_101864 [Rhodobacter aestuarii]|uniref:Glycosyl transferase family 2 n=1 Tax=Rhodobacter aestuarii TaxID=453582 RepID=A0A1N7PDI9_9RHOB|nr:hypothetical protein [Rhodobacter aestuarii]PTV97746.1 hypothetical protein C8J27_101864 [Rhodobacter aestuarii]SIT08449.1 hypothetical protein SAMN05421580_109224 [Rhodobacter aestuarii]
MDYTSQSAFLATAKTTLAKGPVAVVLVEDLVEVESTLRHHLAAGFRTMVVYAPEALVLPEDLSAQIHRIPWDMHREGALTAALNPLIAAAPPGTWLYYCFNAEYLFHPFCEHRNVREMLAFHTEERRSAMLTYVVDLYAPDLEKNPNGVNLDEAMLDRAGYYALGRPDPANHNHPRERQLDFFGGLRWRFDEHIPAARRKIDRIALFRTAPGLELRPDHRLNNEELNTYACPWHNNLTAAIVSFRVAKALKRNPGSTYDIPSFVWHNSERFSWTGQQLMDLGLMEPGQWF